MGSMSLLAWVVHRRVCIACHVILISLTWALLGMPFVKEGDLITFFFLFLAMVVFCVWRPSIAWTSDIPQS